jgi:hypothetical protein
MLRFVPKSFGHLASKFVLYPPVSQDREKGARGMDQSLILRVDETVAKVFDPMRSAEETLARLAKVVEPTGQLAQLTNVFEQIGKFQEELADLSAAFEPVKGFHSHLENLATASSRCGLFRANSRMSQPPFHKRLVQLAAAMEPATAFQAQLQHLIKAFEPAKALQHGFVQLSRAFGDAQFESAPSEDERPRAADVDVGAAPGRSPPDGSTILL